jgi:hypothetical protein
LLVRHDKLLVQSPKKGFLRYTRHMGLITANARRLAVDLSYWDFCTIKSFSYDRKLKRALPPGESTTVCRPLAG